jgi:hypothetical protein
MKTPNPNVTYTGALRPQDPEILLRGRVQLIVALLTVDGSNLTDNLIRRVQQARDKIDEILTDFQIKA